MCAQGTTLRPWKSAPNAGAVRRPGVPALPADKAGRRFSEASDWPLRMERGHLTGSEVAVPLSLLYGSCRRALSPPLRHRCGCGRKLLPSRTFGSNLLFDRELPWVQDAGKASGTAASGGGVRVENAEKADRGWETISSKDWPIGPQRRPEKRRSEATLKKYAAALCAGVMPRTHSD